MHTVARPGPRWVLKLALAVLATAAVVFLLRRLPVQELIPAFGDWAAAAGPGAIFLYGLLFVAGALLCVPVFAFSIGAGFFFGIPAGLAISLAALAASSAAAYLLGCTIACARIRRLSASRPTLAAIDQAIGESGWKLVALLRLNPVLPFGPGSYFLGATSVRFVPFLVGSVIGMLPDTLVYVVLGSAGQRLMEKGAPRSAAQWALLGVGVVATVLAVLLVTRIARRKLEEARQAAAGVTR